jgi:hypothetical protein
VAQITTNAAYRPARREGAAGPNSPFPDWAGPGVIVASVSVMPAAPAPDPAEALAQRLADPRTVAALNTVLDHADLLAVLVSGLDSLVSRSETITDSLIGGVTELRAAGEPARASAAQLVTTAQQLGTLTPALLDKLPVLEALLGSDLADPRVIEVASMASRAVTVGADQAERSGLKVSGVRAILRALKDPDVSRALGFLLGIAKALGKELDKAGKEAR